MDCSQISDEYSPFYGGLRILVYGLEGVFSELFLCLLCSLLVLASWFLLIHLFMLNIVSWNCRGAGARSFPSLVRDSKMNYNIHVLIILEPRISGERADKVISKLGFNNNFRVEAEGYSVGILILWDESTAKLDIISTSNQYIHTSIKYIEDTEGFFLTCIYGSPTPTLRQNLWTSLDFINGLVNNAKWLCMGDFNSYKGVDDKHEGCQS